MTIASIRQPTFPAFRAGAIPPWPVRKRNEKGAGAAIPEPSRACTKGLAMAAKEQQSSPCPANTKPNYGIVGTSPAIAHVLRLIKRLGPSDENLLIQGESGTGKELVACAVHAASPRAAGPFVAFNCAAIQETLLESEVFGHEKGAFTSAHAAKPGLFEVAEGGTLFLDEVGEMKGPFQAKLLRVLEDRRIRRVGSVHWARTNVRVVAATNRDLAHDIAEHRFRRDLYYRLAVLMIKLPPLRERLEDVPLLVRHFLSLEPDGPQEIDLESMNALLAHDWPGNARELRNAVKHAQVLAEGPSITLRDLPEEVLHGAAPALRQRSPGVGDQPGARRAAACPAGPGFAWGKQVPCGPEPGDQPAAIVSPPGQAWTPRVKGEPLAAGPHPICRAPACRFRRENDVSAPVRYRTVSRLLSLFRLSLLRGHPG